MRTGVTVLLSLLLVACSSTGYESQVSSEGFTEDYTGEQTTATELKQEKQTPESGKQETGGSVATIDAPTQGFSIQFATLSNKEAATAFAAQLPVTDTVWLQKKSRDDHPYYSIVMGDYADYDVAKETLAQLPPQLQKHKPFIKNYSDKELASGASFERID